MLAVEKTLIDAFRANPGGVGEYLTEEQKRGIREGSKNHAENSSPWDKRKLLDGVDEFMKNHPVEWLDR